MTAAQEAKESMERKLKELTGRSLSEWVETARASGTATHGKIVAHLKEKHGITHGYANLIAHELLQSSNLHASGEDLVESQYAGAKSALRPIYEALAGHIRAFGDDVEFAPKKAYVSVRRRKQFALIQPSTATRLDVGVNLKNVPATSRLERSGSFNSMVSHRVRLASVADVDAELVGWLRHAYDEA